MSIQDKTYYKARQDKQDDTTGQEEEEEERSLIVDLKRTRQTRHVDTRRANHFVQIISLMICTACKSFHPLINM